jgi:hypothetical protein
MYSESVTNGSSAPSIKFLLCHAYDWLASVAIQIRLSFTAEGWKPEFTVGF